MYIEKLQEILKKNPSKKDDFLILKNLLNFIQGKDKTFSIEKVLTLNEKNFSLAIAAYNEYLLKCYYGQETKINAVIFETENDTLCNQKTFSTLCLDHGLNLDTRYINIYYKRGKLPSEDVILENRPYWKQSTILEFIQQKRKVVQRIELNY